MPLHSVKTVKPGGTIKRIYLKDMFNYEDLIMWFSDPAHLVGTNNCEIMIIEVILLAAPMCVLSTRNGKKNILVSKSWINYSIMDTNF